MKYLFTSLLICFISIYATAQIKHINVAFNKTIHLYFERPVTYFDLGSNDVLIEQTEIPNMLKLKSAIKGFKETNLTVLTDNKEMYSFILNYKEDPDTLTYRFNQQVHVLESTESNNEIVKKEETKSNQLLSKKIIGLDGSTMASIKSMQMVVLLKGVYVSDNKLYFHLNLTNYSNINYDLSFIKFNIKNVKKGKKSSIQEVELPILYSFDERVNTVTSAKGSLDKVFVFDKFSIPSDKKLIVDLWEDNGDRNLSLFIPGSVVLNAKPIKL